MGRTRANGRSQSVYVFDIRIVDRYSRFITKKSEYFGRRENLYDYDGEASRALAKLGKQIVDDCGCI